MKDPNLTQVLETAFDDEKAKIHTALPCRVLKFSTQDNTVQVEFMINELSRDGVSIELPPADDVPVQFFRGGDFVVTTPIKKGDFGLCIFSERCIDTWFAMAKKQEPPDARMHDYSDGFFLTGFSPRPSVVKDVDLDGICLRTLDKSTYLKLAKGTIFISGNIQHQGNYQLSGIMTNNDTISGGISLKDHTHTGDSGGTTSKPK